MTRGSRFLFFSFPNRMYFIPLLEEEKAEIQSGVAVVWGRGKRDEQADR